MVNVYHYIPTHVLFYEGFDASDMANSTITSGFLGVQMGDGPHHMVQKKYGKLVALGIPYFRTKPIVLPARKKFPKGERISLPIYSWSHGRLDVYMHTLSFFVYISYMYIYCRFANMQVYMQHQSYVYIYIHIRFIYIYAHIYTHTIRVLAGRISSCNFQLCDLTWFPQRQTGNDGVSPTH